MRPTGAPCLRILVDTFDGEEDSVSTIGRNDPCPCGSGRKYKRCHLGAEEPGQPAGVPGRAAVHDLDGRLVGEMIRYARGRFGDAWRHDVLDDYPGELDARESHQLFVPWSVYHRPVEGRPVAAWFSEEQGGRLSEAERSWLAAQAMSWLSVWEVTEVDEGTGLSVEDMLTSETRVLHEVSGSRTLVVRDALLGRVVDHRGISVFCGIHPRPLPPRFAEEVVLRVRSALRRRVRAVPVERLREPGVADLLIGLWEEAVQVRNARPLPKLVNTDGEDLIMTKDRFAFDRTVRGQIESRLLDVEGSSAEEGNQGETIFTFMRPGNKIHKTWENTIVGSAVLAAESLDLETNSRARADQLRERVEVACGGLIEHRAREEAESETLLREARTREPTPRPVPPPEALQILREMKEKHYEEWIDKSLPGLGGLTPRQAARARGASRRQLVVLLKEIENHESRSPPQERYDLGTLRRSLGIDGEAPGPRKEPRADTRA